MKVIYIAGPYRAESENDVFENIIRARDVAVRLWGMGFAVICPHTNSIFMGSKLGDDKFLEGDLEILRRCDAVLRLPGASKGDDLEVREAELYEIPVCYDIREL